MRKRRSRRFWTDLIKQLERSGEDPAVFAAKHGVGGATLRGWVYQLRREKLAAPQLLPVRVIATAAPVARRAGDDERIDLELRRGLRLRVPIGADPGYVAALVASLDL